MPEPTKNISPLSALCKDEAFLDLLETVLKDSAFADLVEASHPVVLCMDPPIEYQIRLKNGKRIGFTHNRIEQNSDRPLAFCKELVEQVVNANLDAM